MKISASNVLAGTVTAIQADGNSALVTVDIGNNQHVTAAVARDSLSSLEIEQGKEVFAVINAWDVMIGTHHHTR